ncbi:MAG: NUDIX hydrolase [Dehalococcoidia bacterium]
MTPDVTVTDELLHRLVTGSHAEGITEIAVACTVDHEDRTLLIAEPGLDFIDGTWELPTGWVLPGETLTDALAKVLATVGLDLDEVTGYLGHQDRIDAEERPDRVFYFAVTVTRPDRICRSALIGHWWADPCDLPELPAPPRSCSAAAATTTPSRSERQDPPLAGPLRNNVHGLSALRAGIELFIRHGTWLLRSDFCDRFVHLDTSITNGTELATIDWSAAITALGTDDLPCSGGERRMLRLAASLVEGIPVDLRDTLTGLDARNLHLVSQAVHDTAGR